MCSSCLSHFCLLYIKTMSLHPPLTLIKGKLNMLTCVIPSEILVVKYSKQGMTIWFWWWWWWLGISFVETDYLFQYEFAQKIIYMNTKIRIFVFKRNKVLNTQKEKENWKSNKTKKKKTKTGGIRGEKRVRYHSQKLASMRIWKQTLKFNVSEAS